MSNSRRHPPGLRRAGVKPYVLPTSAGLGCHLPAQGLATCCHSSAHPFPPTFFFLFPEFQV